MTKFGISGITKKIIISVLRYPRALLRRTVGLFSNLLWTLKWNFIQAKSNNKQPMIGHLLLVKKTAYVQVARICISSFLHYNPNAVLKVHCDEVTYKKTRLMVRFLSKKNQVQVILDQSNVEKWQFSKLQLILSLSGSKDFYMDADLKWNGPLPAIASTTFFVREFVLSSKKEYVQLLSNMGMKKMESNTMKNTSFFSWGGKTAPERISSQLLRFWDQMLEVIERLPVSKPKKDALSRISEQLALSALVAESESNYIKTSDSQFDGTFVESSYFGATGTKFGWFGITSK